MHDVLVIGGGPVGSSVAYRLADMGYGVVVLEKYQQLREQVCCTGIISQECVTAFGIDNSLVLRQINSARLYSPSGKCLRLWREEPQASVVNRVAFNQAMAGRAQGKGAEYRFNTLVTDLEIDDSGVMVAATCEGDRVSFRARAGVITTGFGPVPAAGLGEVGDFVIGTQVEVEVNGVDEIEIYLGQEMAPGFFAWLVPISPGRALVGLLVRSAPGLYLKKLLLSLLNQGKLITADVKPVFGGIPLRPLSRTCRDRLLVVGTAAGQVKPTTGGGIYFGLLSAEIAADTLHRGLTTDDLSTRGLAGYEKGWRRKLAKELEIDYYARRFYQRLSDRQIDKIFDIMENNGIGESLLKARDLSFDWHSRAVLRLMGYRALSRALEEMKIPFRPGGKV